MNQDKIDLFISTSLIAAAELAFIEEAPATGSFLKKLVRIRVYLAHKNKSTALIEELSVLEDFVKLLSVRYPDRIELKTPVTEECDCLYVSTGSVLTAFEMLVSETIESENERMLFSIEITRTVPIPELILSKRSGGVQRRIRICLSRC